MNAPTRRRLALASGVIAALTPALAAGATSAAARPAAQAATGCRGMTWSIVHRDLSRPLFEAHQDHATDAYHGDTDCGRSLPILCLKPMGLPLPPGINPDFYNGWSGGQGRLTAPVQGSQLTSRAAADGYCSAKYGPGFRMGEHHDGGGGWGWWAQGHGFRAWVTSSAAQVNPWDTTTGKALTWTVQEQSSQANRITFAADFRSNANRGDMALRVRLGLLCIRTGRAGISARLTAPVSGSSLGARDDANALCLNSFGEGWRPVDVALLRGPRLVAAGSERMWVAINDQPANPWNSR